MTSVVVLNSSFQYHADVDIKKFWSWLVKGKIHVVVSHDGNQPYVNYSREPMTLDQAISTFKVRRPLVVQLLKFAGYHPKTEEIGWSKEAVFQRDNNICQYWHYNDENKRFKHRCTMSERTLDHVIPKCRGGENVFENTVCSCSHCNIDIKKNRTPQEAGLKLIRKPFVPRRNKRDFVYMRFAYDPNKLSHKIYKNYILKAEQVK